MQRERNNSSKHKRGYKYFALVANKMLVVEKVRRKKYDAIEALGKLHLVGSLGNCLCIFVNVDIN